MSTSTSATPVPTRVHAPSAASPEEPVSSGGPETEGANAGGNADGRPALEFDPAKFGFHGSEKVKISEGLKKSYSDLVKTVVEQLSQYQQDVKGAQLSPEMREFLTLYDNQAEGESILDTEEGWTLAHLVIEQEMLLRFARIENDIRLEIEKSGKFLKPGSTKIPLEAEDANGLLRKYGLDAVKLIKTASGKQWLRVGGIVLSFPISLPYLGIRKLIESASLQGQKEFSLDLKDFRLNINKLPPHVIQYINHIDPKLGVETTRKFLKDAAKATVDFYHAFGVPYDQLGAATFWERMDPSLTNRSKAAKNANTELAQVDIGTRWMRIRNNFIDEIINQATSKGTPIDLSNPEAVAKLLFDAQTKTIRHFLNLHLKEIAASSENTTGALQALRTKLAEIENPATLAKKRKTEIDKVRKDIGRLKGIPATEGTTAVKGEIEKLEEELKELEAKLKGPDGGRSLEAVVQEKRDKAGGKQSEVEGVEDKIRVLGEQIDRLKEEISEEEKTAKKEQQEIREGDEYKRLYAECAEDIKKGSLIPLDALQRQYQAEFSAIQAEIDAEVRRKFGDKANDKNRKDVSASFQERIKNLNERYAGQMEKHAKYEPLYKLQEKINTIDTKMQNVVVRIKEKVEAIRSDIRKLESEDLVTKRSELKRAQEELKSAEGESSVLENKKKRGSRALNRKKAELHQKEEELRKLETATLEDFPDLEKARAELKGVIGAMGRFELILDEVANPGGNLLGIRDLTEETEVPEYSTNYPEGYLRILNHLFQIENILGREEVLKAAIALLSPEELAGIIHQKFNIVSDVSETDLKAVFSAVRQLELSQVDFSTVFIQILSHIKKKGLTVANTVVV